MVLSLLTAPLMQVPYFIDELTVTSIELGADIPTIRRSASPKLDSRGMWIDLDIAYDGGFQINLETKVRCEAVE